MQGHGHRRAVQLPCRIHAAARWKDMQRSVRSPADAGPPHSLAQAVPAGARSAWLGWCGARCDCGGKDSQQAPAPLRGGQVCTSAPSTCFCCMWFLDTKQGSDIKELSCTLG